MTLMTFFVMILGIAIVVALVAAVIYFNYNLRREYTAETPAYCPWAGRKFDCFYFDRSGDSYHAVLFHCDYPILGKIAFCYDKVGDTLVFREVHWKGRCQK